MLKVIDASKRYGSVVALDSFSAEFAPGEIHAILGENGAGKSTLMGILSGFVMPSAGTVELDDRAIPLGRAFDCKRLGIEMIHQHFTLVPEFTVAENLALARLDGLFERSRIMERARPSLEAAARLGWALEPTTKARNLSVGSQQRLEILKALGGNARVLILDEPTAVLSPDEVLDLFRVLRALRDEGRTIVLIAHKLSEVLAVADRVTVLRRGKFVATAPRSQVDETILAQWMVGEMPVVVTREEAQTRAGFSARDLMVKGERGEIAVQGVSFEIRRGEVLGIGGVDGNGQIELGEAVAGIRPYEGEVAWQGEALRVGYIPQDRQIDGLALEMSVEENLMIGTKLPLVLRPGQIREWARGLIDRFEIRTSGPTQRVGDLSGGNQQKVVVSRTLSAAPNLIVAVNPTRGLDIRAARFVHDRLRDACREGAAILLISTDLDELAELADRTLFISRGHLSSGTGPSAVVGG